MSILVWLRHRLRPDVICAEERPERCDNHARLDGPCRCLEPEHHRGDCKCGQGARWPNHERSKA